MRSPSNGWGNSTGIFAGSRIGSPISTRTRRTFCDCSSISSSKLSTPRPVSIFKRRAARDAVVVNVFRHAADAVAAHFRLGAVGVVHPHSGVGLIARADQDQPVAADAEMPVGNPPGQRGRIGGKRFRETVDVHVVVAGSVHFGEVHDIVGLGFWDLGLGVLSDKLESKILGRSSIRIFRRPARSCKASRFRITFATVAGRAVL